VIVFTNITTVECQVLRVSSRKRWKLWSISPSCRSFCCTYWCKRLFSGARNALV